MADVRYTPSPKGLRMLGMTDFIRDTAVQGAYRVAREADKIHPAGTYQVNPAVVTAGWDNERRMGAVVSDRSDDFDGFRRRSLLGGIEKAKE